MEYEPETRSRLVAYLESGSLLVQYRGQSQCRFCRVLNGSKELYDGDWAWPEGLTHYLRQHPIALPPDFVRHALSQPGPTRPSGDPEKRIDELDDSDWITWARPFRTPAVAKMLEQASEVAVRACQAKLDAKAAELAAKHGVSEKSCAWAGCDRRALVGKAICPSHVADNERSLWLSMAEAVELGRVLASLPVALAPRP